MVPYCLASSIRCNGIAYTIGTGISTKQQLKDWPEVYGIVLYSDLTYLKSLFVPRYMFGLFIEHTGTVLRIDAFGFTYDGYTITKLNSDEQTYTCDFIPTRYIENIKSLERL